MARQWYYQFMGEVFGPFSGAELKQEAALGKINEDALIRKGEDGQWVSPWRVKGLLDQASSEAAPVEPKHVEPEHVEPEHVEPEHVEPEHVEPEHVESEHVESEHVESRSTRKSTTRNVAIVAVVVVLLVTGYTVMRGSKASINPLQTIANAQLQSRLESAIESDDRNDGITVSVYYANALDHDTVVFDIQEITGSKSRLDVFRVLLDFAEEMKEERLDNVQLACRGVTKFQLDGFYFRTLGEERDFQNPAYTIRTFPENLKTPSGLDAYPSWSGGLLGVLNKQMEDFSDFHDSWYLNDL